MKDGSSNASGGALRRWEIAELAIECRARVVRSAARSYPRVTADRVEELYDKVWERATAPVGEPAAFPEHSYEKLEPWLRAALNNELRHEVSDRHSHTRRVHDPSAMERQADLNADPAGTVEQRHVLDELLRDASESLSERTRTYIAATRIDGLSRSEFRRRTGWNQKRIQRARKEWSEFAARVRSGAAALAPIAWLRRLLASGGDNAGTGGGLLGSKAIAATCGAAAVCAGGAVGVVEVQRHADHPKRAKIERAAKAPSPASQAPAPAAPAAMASTLATDRAAIRKSKAARAAARARRARKADKRAPVAKEFGPQSLPSTGESVDSSSSGSSGYSGSSGGDSGSAPSKPSSSFQSEFSP